MTVHFPMNLEKALMDKIYIVSFTQKGAELSLKLQNIFPDAKLYSKYPAENINMLIVSVYDTYMQAVSGSEKKSMKYFEEAWDEWQDEDLKDIPYVEIKKKKMKVNGNPFYMKSVRYETEQPITWHFGLLLHVQTSKCCVISSTQVEDDSINDFMKLVETIRF